MCKNVKYLLKNITVEPALLLHAVIANIMDFLNTNLFLQKACRFNQTSEPDLHSKCDNESQGLLFVSQVNANYRWITTVVSLIYLILATSWSDVAGCRRRPLINFPIIGQILQAFSGCLHSYFWQWIPISAVASKYFLEISTGGSLLLSIATQMYICDVSNKQDRTMRLGFLWLMKLISVPIGKGSTGFILTGLGFFYSYLACLMAAMVSLMFSLIFIRDTSTPVEKVRIRDFANLSIITDGFKVVFRKGLKYKRTVVSLLLIVNTLGWTSIGGEHTVEYLFFKSKFKWNEQMYSSFQLFRSIGIVCGTLFCSIVLSNLMRVHDGKIGALASFFSILAACGYLFAYQDWHFYAVSLFDIFHGSSISVSISFLSKFYEGSEYGRLHAVLSVFCFFIPVGYALYNKVFQYTFTTKFLSGFYLITVMMNFIILVMYIISYYLDEKSVKSKQPEKEQEPMM